MATAGSQLACRSLADGSLSAAAAVETPDDLPGTTWAAPSGSQLKKQQQQQQQQQQHSVITVVDEFTTPPPQRDLAWGDSGPNEVASAATMPTGGIGGQLSRLFRRRGRSSEKVRSFRPLEKSASVGSSGGGGSEQRRRAWEEEEEGDGNGGGGVAMETESSTGALSVGQRLAEKLKLASRKRL